MSRIVCLFSCGAASAVATKIAISEADGRELIVYRNYVKEEHPDNERFSADCKKWFGVPIHTAINEEYEGSIYEVFRRVKFMKGNGVATCSYRLKRLMRERDLLPTDTLVLGYTFDERDRLDRFIDSNNGTKVLAPLIDKGLTKDDCLGILWKAGIKIPEMYEMGYQNNNCIGCVKGGMGYWNKVRIDFPPTFERMAKVQDLLGPGSYFWQNKKTGERISLRALNPSAGDYLNEPEIQCGVVCELVNIELLSSPAPGKPYKLDELDAARKES